MPITQNAKKAMRVQERKRVYNLRRKRAMKDAVKQVLKLVSAGNMQEAEQKLPEAYEAIDKAAKRGVITDNTAARKKSRLSQHLKQQSQ